MGIHRRDRRWRLSTTYRPSTVTGCKGKQADQIFLPTTRQPASLGAGRRLADPSSGDWGICIKGKAGRGCEVVVQSLEWQDADLLALVRRHEVVVFGKWQLLPPNAPVDVSRGCLASLGHRQAPPLVVQAAASQRCCFVQEVTVDGNGVAGAPMVLSFRALFDREPGTGETDVVVTDQDFREITATVF